MSDKDAKILAFPSLDRPDASSLVPDDAPRAPVFDLIAHQEARAARRPRSERDGVSYRTVQGEVELVVVFRGRKRIFVESPENMQRWAEGLLSAIRDSRRRMNDDEVMALWQRAATKESVSLPGRDAGGFWDHEISNTRERLSKASALSVARRLYYDGLDAASSATVAEQLTGRRLASGSDPASRGDAFVVTMRGRLEGVLLLNWWREELAKLGLAPLSLKIRDKANDEALLAAQRAQKESGARTFTYQRTRRGWRVWLWQGSGGQTLDPLHRHRVDAVTWAKEYATTHGFPYAEPITKAEQIP